MIYKDFRSSVLLHIDALMPCHNINLYLLLMAPKMVQLPHFSLVHGLVVFVRGGEISLKKLPTHIAVQHIAARTM